jgi:hypothetical protein
LERRKLAVENRILRTRIGEAGRIGVDCALRGLVRISEGAGLGRRGQSRGAGGAYRKDAAARDFVHGCTPLSLSEAEMVGEAAGRVF